MNFDKIAMNPPYSLKWSADKKLLKDSRFKHYQTLAPKSKADYAFVLHAFYHLKKSGTMAVVLPHGVLFRGGREGKIRKQLLEDGSIDALIGLPPKLFNATSIPTIIMVLKKDKPDKSVLFIDASREFEKEKNQNVLRKKDIQKILNTWRKRKEIKRYSHLASFSEIKENGFNLNLPRYVDTFVPEPPVDLLKVTEDLHTTNQQIRENELQLADMLGQLTSKDQKVMAGVKALIKELKADAG